MATKNVNAEMNAEVNVTTPVVDVEPQVSTPLEGDNYKKIITQLVAGGAKKYNNLKIKNVNVLDADTYVRVSITIVPNVPAYINEERTESNVIFTSLFALVAVLKNNEEYAWMANTLLERPNILPLILCGGTINILQREYEAGEDVPNPWSNRETEPRVYDHNVIVNDVIDITLGKAGIKMADKLADKILGF